MADIHDCIVVGAGAAGILAAVTLREAGRDVIVLEARDRIGGRANSVPLSDGTMVERGAQFVHGSVIPTWEFIVRFGLRTHQADLAAVADPPSVFKDGKWGAPDPVAKEAAEGLERAIGRPNPDTLSLREALQAAGLRGETLAAAERMMSVEAPMSPEKLSARAASEIHHIEDTLNDPLAGVPRPGNPNAQLVDGYQRLWDVLSDSIQDVLRLSTPVEALDWSDRGVAAHSGSQQFRAKTAIVTVPVGVLQAGIPEFRPGLPAAKQAAFADMGTGDLLKVIAEFKSPFWEKTLGNVPSLRYADSSLFPITMSGFWDRPGPPTLITFAGTPHATELRGNQGRARSEFLGQLAKMFPDVDSESELVSLEVVDWAADPWARGGVSVVPVGRYQARADLAAPTPPLFWAGEATHFRGYAECVHGALETGRRAAFEVVHATQPASASGSDAPLDWWQYNQRMRV